MRKTQWSNLYGALLGGLMAIGAMMGPAHATSIVSVKQVDIEITTGTTTADCFGKQIPPRMQKKEFQTRTYSLLLDDGTATTIDFFKHLEKNSTVFGELLESEPLLNPARNILAIRGESGRKSYPWGTHVFFIFYNAEKQQTKRIDTDLSCDAKKEIWVNEHALLVKEGLTGDTNVIVDFKTETMTDYDGGQSFCCDTNAKNYASLWGYDIWFLPLKQQGYAAYDENWKRRFDVGDYSTELRYNGYWVYPKTTLGWLSKRDYKQNNWIDKVDVGDQNPGGYGIANKGILVKDKIHDFCVPTFLGNSAWVGFAESVYSTTGTLETNRQEPKDEMALVKRNARLLEMNIVCVDAHSVSTNPPDPNDIKILKKTIPNIEGIEFSRDAASVWNKEKQCLEIWKSDRIADTLKEKLVEIPISFDPLVLGEPVVF